MVLLNGVKYACERCIRGHRVSLCTHTDKPLTMIKPKGRPASQCAHCREQRKLKSTHTACSCGTKGKSQPHHPLCLCYTTLHCTCPLKEKKEPKKKKEKEKEEKPPVEEVGVPFDMNSGLLDYFNTDQRWTEDERYFDPARLPNPPLDLDLDLVENMLPLFPLVGAGLFDDLTLLPLLPLPDNKRQPEHLPPVTPMTYPRPLKPQSLFSFQHRPRRPESVLLVALTLLNTLRQNAEPQFALPKLQSLAAFPPFHSGINSAEDLNAGYDALYDALLLMPSDHEELRHTPSLVPSRQPLRSKRLLLRLHLQLHHQAMAKEHPLVPLKLALLLELSPNFMEPQNLESLFTPNLEQIDFDKVFPEMRLGATLPDYVELLEIGAVPMFEEFLGQSHLH